MTWSVLPKRYAEKVPRAGNACRHLFRSELEPRVSSPKLSLIPAHRSWRVPPDGWTTVSRCGHICGCPDLQSDRATCTRVRSATIQFPAADLSADGSTCNRTGLPVPACAQPVGQMDRILHHPFAAKY